jgi:cytochrome P450
MSAVKEIYTVKETYAKSEFYTRLTAPTNKNVFAVTNIDLHRRYRRLLSAAMSETSLKSMYPTIEANVNLAIQRIGEELQKRGAADVFKWWLFLATDIIGELSFGESFRMLEKKQKNQYIEDLESAGFVAAMRALFPTAMRVAKFLPLPWLRYASESTERTRLSAEESIRRHERLEQADPTNVKPTLFSKMYKAEEDEQLTFNEVVDNAVGYIIAGSDTSATTLTYLVWCVCKHPEVKAALLRELATLPADGGYGDQELKQLPYLNAVIEETLRIHGAAPASLPRVVPRGGASLAGYWLNEGTTVSSQAYTLHRNPMTFPEPEKFDPSRWLAPTKAMKDAFFAFGGGSRSKLSPITGS